MKDIDNLCMNCFDKLTQGSVCPNCDFDNDDLQADMMYLQPKSILNDRYVIGTVVCHDSDAVVYMAYDMQLEAKVNIREFLPKGIANRLEGNNDVHVRQRYKNSYEKYKQSFINLWTTIIKMRNLSAVIPTYDVFELNGTAYAVSEYTESIPLREFLLRNPDGNIPWDQARLMFMPVLTTLESLHSNGIIHGGISPDNLVLCRDGKVRLKSFCISQANTISSDLEFNVNEGYTALEQYDNNHKMCNATDIYAFSACIFRALVGQNPPEATSREVNDKLMIPNIIAENIPTHVIKALGGGLQIYPEKRTQSVEALREQLNATPNVVAAAAQPKRNEKASEATDSIENEEHYRGYPEYNENDNKRKGVKIAIAVLVVLIIIACVVGAVVLKNGGFSIRENESTTQSVSVESYTVPDFVTPGYTQSDIENNGVWNNQFAITFESDYSDDVPEGVIFKQSVVKGESLEQGQPIILTVSLGVKKAEIPDVGGLSIEDATKTLEKLGFKVSTVEIYNDGAHTKGTVKASYGMAPAAGETIAVGEEVILQVYGEVVTTTQPETTTANDGNQ